MRSEQLIIVLLVAVTTAHPVPKPRGGDHVSREVQYSDIVAAYSSTAAEAHTGAHDRRELQYSDIVAVSGPLAPTPHGDAWVRRELEYSEIVALTGPPGKWQHASRHSGHGHHDSSGGSLLSSLMHETRSDIAGRVLEGIKHFLSHVLRDAPEETDHAHEHEHEHRRGHHNHEHEHEHEYERDVRHPRHSVIDNILDFLSKAAR